MSTIEGGMICTDDDLVGDVLRAADANWQFYVARLGGASGSGCCGA